MAKVTIFTMFNGHLNEPIEEECPTKENALKRASYYRTDSKVVGAVVSDGKEMIIC